MLHYRLYFFRSETGHIREVREFEAPHDFAAIYQSQEWRSGEFMELWSGARKVARWPACCVPQPTIEPSIVHFPPTADTSSSRRL